MSQHEIQHPHFGRGQVLKSRNNGFELFVRFETSKRWVRRSDLLSVDREVNATALPDTQLVSHDDQDQFNARRIVEALRFGMAPIDAVEQITFGRDREIDQFRNWLERDDGVLLIEGEYGVGKTHLLELLSAHALQQGFAVSRVSVDAHETTFDRPKGVYRSIIESLRYISSSRDSAILGFRPMIRAALEHAKTTSWTKHHEYFRALEDNIENESVWDWIEGTADSRPPTYDTEYFSGYYFSRGGRWVKYPAMYSQALSSNLYTWLLSSLGWIARMVLGLKGLLVLVDEAEAFSAASTLVREDRAINHVTGLIRVANNDPALLQPAWQSDLDYYAHTSHIPFLFDRPCGLKLVFAFADLGVLSSRIPLAKKLPTIRLNPLEEQDLAKAIEQMCEMYYVAYRMDERISKEIVAKALEIVPDGSNTRRLAKACIEICDIWREDPHWLFSELEHADR